jgi:hypothetical protein
MTDWPIGKYWMQFSLLVCCIRKDDILWACSEKMQSACQWDSKVAVCHVQAALTECCTCLTVLICVRFRSRVVQISGLCGKDTAYSKIHPTPPTHPTLRISCGIPVVCCHMCVCVCVCVYFFSVSWFRASCISKWKHQLDATILSILCHLISSLYMFRVLHPPIIRSFKPTFRYGTTGHVISP